ncbi:MAG: hypothetical protein KDI79_20600 [Anaerolineae bacterium]|nr:hypothetical protein [Anaerolineae bacterium]
MKAAQAVLTSTETWGIDRTDKVHATRRVLEKVQALLAIHPLQLPSDPIIIETLPYLKGYADWLQTKLHDDPLMLEVQATLERKRMPTDWSNLGEAVLIKAFITAGRHALHDVPELSVEQVLTNQGEEALTFHIARLTQLATPLINLNRPAMPAKSGGPSTLDIICWEQGAVSRLQNKLENHGADPVSIASTSDPQRVTYIRLVLGFNLKT